MKLTTALALIALAMPLGLQAQGDNRPGGDRQPALPGGLDRILMLTPDQVMKLREHQRASQMAIQEVNRQVGMARRMLNQAARAEPVDNAAVGALFVQITGLQRQVAGLRQSQRQAAPDALGLTMEQRERLGALQRAITLQAPAQAALRLNLIGPGRANVDNGGEPRDVAPPAGAPGGGQPPVLTMPDPMNNAAGDDEDARAILDMLSALSEETAENVRRIADRLSVVPVTAGSQ